MKYSIELTKKGIALSRQNVSGRRLVCLDGLCAANPENLEQPRDREWYKTNVLLPGIMHGRIQDGTKSPYDDRKPRLDEIFLQEGVLEVHLGITTYQAMATDVHRNLGENAKLQERGKARFKNKFAFFSRAAGVTAVPVTKEKTIFLGQRIGTKEYPNFLNFASGYVEYKEIASETDLEKEASRELQEEFGIIPQEIVSSEFIGIFGNSETGEADFAFLFSTSIPETYFIDGGWKRRVAKKEHQGLIRIADMNQVETLLKGKLPENVKGIMYNSQGVLESLRPEDLQH